MIFWICPKLVGEHQDREVVRVTADRIFCRADPASAPVKDPVGDRSSRDSVKDLLGRTVPTGSTTVKTNEAIVSINERTSN